MGKMKRICDYEIISFKSLDEVVKYVKQGLDMGWQPHGSLQMDHCPDEFGDIEEWFGQAMVKYELDEEEI